MAVEMVEKIEGQRIFRSVWVPWDAPVRFQRLDQAMKVNRFEELECGRGARKPVGMVYGAVGKHTYGPGVPNVLDVPHDLSHPNVINALSVVR